MYCFSGGVDPEAGFPTVEFFRVVFFFVGFWSHPACTCPLLCVVGYLRKEPGRVLVCAWADEDMYSNGTVESGFAERNLIVPWGWDYD